MEFKGTKGEWKSVYNGHYYDITTSLDNNRQSFAMTSKNGVLGVTEDIQKANALLISKAPEMLQMIDELLKELEFHGYTHSTTICEARQLIKEATEL